MACVGDHIDGCYACIYAVPESDTEVEGSGHHHLHDICDAVSTQPCRGDD